MEIIYGLLGVLFIVALLSGSPTDTYQIKPAEDSNIYKNGLTILNKQKQNTSIKITEYTAYPIDNHIAFKLEISNLSSQNITIEPEKFYIDTESNHKIYAQNPEEKIKKINTEIAKKKDDLSQHQTVSLIGSTVNLISDISQFGKRTSEELKADDQEDTERRKNDKETEDRLQRNINNLQEKRKKWETSLRKNTLSTNQTLTGKIYFPLSNDNEKHLEASKRFKLIVPITNNDQIQFSYRLEKVKTK